MLLDQASHPAVMRPHLPHSDTRLRSRNSHLLLVINAPFSTEFSPINKHAIIPPAFTKNRKPKHVSVTVPFLHSRFTAQLWRWALLGGLLCTYAPHTSLPFPGAPTDVTSAPATPPKPSFSQPAFTSSDPLSVLRIPDLLLDGGHLPVSFKLSLVGLQATTFCFSTYLPDYSSSYPPLHDFLLISLTTKHWCAPNFLLNTLLSDATQPLSLHKSHNNFPVTSLSRTSSLNFFFF